MSPDLVTELQEVFADRNAVIHHFFLDRFDGQEWARLPTDMVQELLPLYQRLTCLQDRVDALLDQLNRDVAC